LMWHRIWKLNIYLFVLTSTHSKKSTLWTAFLIMFYFVLNVSCLLAPLMYSIQQINRLLVAQTPLL